MFKITKHEKVLIVNALTQAELEIVSAASHVFSRVFAVSSITARLKTNFSDTAVYNAIKRLEDKGIFFIHKEENRQLSIRFTEKGRSICSLVKDKVRIEKHDKFMQPSLF